MLKKPVNFVLMLIISCILPLQQSL